MAVLGFLDLYRPTFDALRAIWPLSTMTEQIVRSNVPRKSSVKDTAQKKPLGYMMNKPGKQRFGELQMPEYGL